MEPSDLLPGDLVQARLKGTTADGAPEQWLWTLFPVNTVNGTVVTGSVLYPGGLDAAAGWVFELVDRQVTLPVTLTEITATLSDGSRVPAMGKGDVWSHADTGDAIPADQIIAYTPTP